MAIDVLLHIYVLYARIRFHYCTCVQHTKSGREKGIHFPPGWAGKRITLCLKLYPKVEDKKQEQDVNFIFSGGEGVPTYECFGQGYVQVHKSAGAFQSVFYVDLRYTTLLIIISLLHKTVTPSDEMDIRRRMTKEFQDFNTPTCQYFFKVFEIKNVSM